VLLLLHVAGVAAHSPCEDRCLLELEREQEADTNLHECRTCTPIELDYTNCPPKGYECDPDWPLTSNVLLPNQCNCAELRCHGPKATLFVDGILVHKVRCNNRKWMRTHTDEAVSAVCAKKCGRGVCPVLRPSALQGQTRLSPILVMPPDDDHKCAWAECPNGAQATIGQSTETFPKDSLFTCTGDGKWRVTGPGLEIENLMNIACLNEACQSCDEKLIHIVASGGGAQAFKDDNINNDGDCAVRTLTCEGPDAVIEINAGAETSISDTQLATIEVTCNEDGTAWKKGAVKVTQLKCSSSKPVCQSCDNSLIEKTTNGNGAHEFFSDLPSSDGTCAMRTFTCKGLNAHIEVNHNKGVVKDEDDGDKDEIATLVVKCSTEGVWKHTSTVDPVTQVECASPESGDCKKCTKELITIATSGSGVKSFADDAPSTEDSCAVRTLTCTGKNAKIKVNGGADGSVSDQDDGATDETASIKVKCEAGTEWRFNGKTVTELACTADAPATCKTCANNLITVKPDAAHPFYSDEPTIGSTCAMRTFMCFGQNAAININDADSITDGSVDDEDNVKNDKVSIAVECNGDGTKWKRNDDEVKKLECSSSSQEGCVKCRKNLITVTTALTGSKPFDKDDVLMSGTCASRIFTCKGTGANIEVNGGAGAVSDGDDGSDDGIATLAVSCNEDGTAWTNNGAEVTRVECASGL
ncbi:hypothetical protein PMAYCL1PPCAC_21129, partial [Pristionchus mayeri]